MRYSELRELAVDCVEQVADYLDNSQEMINLYNDAFRHRTRDSFKQKGDTLRVDTSEGSSLTRYVNEIEQPDLVEQLIGREILEPKTRRQYPPEGPAEALSDIVVEQLFGREYWEPRRRRRYSCEGAAEALSDITSGYEDIIVHSDREVYAAPSHGNLAALEIAKKAGEEDNSKPASTVDVYERIYKRLTEQEEDLWSDWLDQRPRKSQATGEILPLQGT